MRYSYGFRLNFNFGLPYTYYIPYIYYKCYKRMQRDMTNRVAWRCLTRKKCKMQRALKNCNSTSKLRVNLGNITHYTLHKLQVFRLSRPRFSASKGMRKEAREREREKIRRGHALTRALYLLVVAAVPRATYFENP